MWKNINQINNYEINESGGIRNKETLHVLTPRINKYGYQEIGLRIKGDRKKYFYKIHRLVAEHFIENKPDNWESLHVDHMDHNKLNNNVNNLRFVTALENCLSRELNAWSTNKTTGELYITKYKNGFMIRINRSDFKKREWCSTLEDAIIKRNMYIDKLTN
jgi:hypothetical protein